MSTLITKGYTDQIITKGYIGITEVAVFFRGITTHAATIQSDPEHKQK